MTKSIVANAVRATGAPFASVSTDNRQVHIEQRGGANEGGQECHRQGQSKGNSGGGVANNHANNTKQPSADQQGVMVSLTGEMTAHRVAEFGLHRRIRRA